MVHAVIAVGIFFFTPATLVISWGTHQHFAGLAVITGPLSSVSQSLVVVMQGTASHSLTGTA